MRRVVQWLPIATGCYALVGGTITVLGWALNVPRLADWEGDGIMMQANAGLLAILIGAAMLPAMAGTKRTVLGSIVVVIGGLTIIENFTNINFGIDQILTFNRPWGHRLAMSPGRMGLPGSIAWTLSGIAMVLMRRKGPTPVAVPIIGIVVSFVASLSLMGYLFGADVLYSWPRFTAIAFQTGTLVLAVALGLIAMAPNFQPVRILTGDSAGGVLARRALPIVVILPLCLGLVCVRALRTGFFEPVMAIALLVLSLIFTLCGILWWGVAALVQREESLRRSEDRFSRFMEQLPGLAWIKDAEGRYLYVNELAERIFGVARESLYGKTDHDLFPKETAEQFRRNDSEAITSGQGIHLVETLKHDDGVVHHSYVSKFPIAGGDDTAVVGGIAIDITDRKRAEETVNSLLRISKQLNATLSIDGLLDILVQEAISLMGTEGGVSGLNTPQGMVCSKYFRHGEELPLEYCWPPMHGLPGWLIVHKTTYVTNDAKSDPQIIQSLCDQFGVWSAVSTPIITAQGDVIGFFELHNKRDGTDFTFADQELLQAVSRVAAISMQNALAYRSLEVAEASLKQADKRKDEFLAVLAHELRNPLAPLRTGLEIFKRSDGNREMLGEAVSAMDRQVTHLVRLVDDLLDLGRISHDKLELRKQRVDLSLVICQAMETCQPLAAREGQTIKLVLPEEPIELDADSIRLAQVFSNLLNNACKFSLPKSDIMVSAAREGDQAVVKVKDDGLGIPPENLEQVFEMFAQLPSNRVHGGLGIGLSLARRLVEMHGGTITAHSEGTGRGSLFEIRLPIPADAQRKATAAAPTDEAKSGPLKVLVVDDNQDAAMTLSLLMRIHGHEAITAGDGVQACDQAESQRPHVILLDIGLPGMSGYDVCRTIRQTAWGKEMTIIALTGWGKDEDRRKSQEAGFDGHLVKPVDHDELMDLLTASVSAGPG